jgi:hypothetical protein
MKAGISLRVLHLLRERERPMPAVKFQPAGLSLSPRAICGWSVRHSPARDRAAPVLEQDVMEQ